MTLLSILAGAPASDLIPPLYANDPLWDQEDDGERLSCEGCGESFNVHDSCSEDYCLRCSILYEDDEC